MNIFVRTAQGPLSINSTDNGVNHLNIHQSSDYTLSRLLSTGARHHFLHAIHGDFQSISGLLLYACYKEDDRFRTYIGNLDSTYQRQVRQSPLFEETVEEGIHCRFKSNQELYYQFMDKAELPLTSYFFYGSTLRDLYQSSRVYLKPFEEIAAGRNLLNHV